MFPIQIPTPAAAGLVRTLTTPPSAFQSTTHAPFLSGVINSAAARSCRKRRYADAHEGASSPRRRRRRRFLLVPNSFLAGRSFALRTLASALHKRRHDAATSSARPSSRRLRLLSPVLFPALRPLSPRVSLATAPRSHRKIHVDDARRAVSTPCRRRRRSSLLPRVRHFRPFALRFLLTPGALSPHRRRKPAEVDMGNLISQLLWKSTRDGVSEAHTKRLDGSPEVVDLTVEPELENNDAVGRMFGDRSVPALGSSKSPEKKATFYEEPHGRRLQESGFKKLKLAELPDPLDNTSKEDLSELFTPLSDKDEREVNALLCSSDDSDKIVVIHTPSNIEITKEKLQCLRPRGWLNDEVINLYIELLKEREKREPNRFLKCHFFNTFFYKRVLDFRFTYCMHKYPLKCWSYYIIFETYGFILHRKQKHCHLGFDIWLMNAGYDYQSVRRWTTFKRLGYGLVECEKIFVPVHRNAHWCLALINMKDKTLQYLESLVGWGRDVLDILARYIVDELKDKSNIEVEPSSWTVVSESLPLQQNGWDCGMFMLKYIDFHSRGIKPSFSQEHMMYFRKRIAKEIMALRAD
ncbi:Ubiquitin-like-specific protease ESD4 [Zea mays]|uniref:Ubiquitin-like-specific protease ESD4 n=2 Tax=Zea mays TaxID=4577 RepID=A0A1D6F488_MAIZE|nr:Ubiquitin-like-specific protease ESD4 [Zea mays]